MAIPDETAGQSLGLAGIRSKINFFKGSMAFDKNRPKGLIVTIELPINAYEMSPDTGGTNSVPVPFRRA